jgi:NhaP-type Na+/H+ or K+/H+ antiporter
MATTLAIREMKKINKLTDGEISPKFLRQNAYGRKFSYMEKICDVGEIIAVTGMALSLLAIFCVMMFWGIWYVMSYPSYHYYLMISDCGMAGIITLFISVIVLIPSIAYQLKVGEVRDFIAESIEQHSDIISPEEIVTVITR